MKGLILFATIIAILSAPVLSANIIFMLMDDVSELNTCFITRIIASLCKATFEGRGSICFYLYRKQAHYHYH